MTTATTEPYRAMSCYSLTGGLLAVPGRREARALTVRACRACGPCSLPPCSMR